MSILDLSPLFEFSRDRCVAICSFLVPANIVVTSQTLLFFFLKRPQWQLRASVALATLLAATMILHVGTWFAIGVVTPITFILVGLASLCLSVNWVAIALYPRYLRSYPQVALRLRQTVHHFLHS
jgi:hypothetical protein